MSELFDRFWKVTVGFAGQQGKVFDDIRTTFNINKTGDVNPNEAEISLFNLEKQSREFIKEKMEIIIEAGYKPGNNHGEIFKGQISLINEGRQGTDWLITITAKDSLKEVRDTHIAKSFGPKSTEYSVIKSLADSMGVTLGSLKGLKLTKKKYNHGKALSGNAAKLLNDMCRTIGAKPLIVDGVLHIIPLDDSVNTTAIRLDDSSGLIESPERTEKGYKVMSLLRHEINPGTLIDIGSERVKGLFIVYNLIHAGDSDGTSNAWITSMEVQPKP